MEKNGQQNYRATPPPPPGYGEQPLNVGNPGKPNYPSNQPPPTGYPGHPQPAPGYPPPAAGYPQAYGQTPRGYGQPQAAFSHRNNTTIVTQPYPTTTGIQGNHNVSTNLRFAIFTCLLCCWPLGAVAIYMSYKSKQALETNNIPLAQQKARSARNFAIAALCCGVVIIVLSMVYRFVWYKESTYHYSYSG